MSEQYVVTAAGVALVAATAKSLIELATPADGNNVIYGIDVMFDGVTASNVPVKVELIQYTTTGTGTGGTAQKVGAVTDKTAKTTVKTNMTVEGTGSILVLATWLVPPTSGVSLQWPLGREPAMPISSFRAIRCTAPNGVNATANAWIEE